MLLSEGSHAEAFVACSCSKLEDTVKFAQLLFGRDVRVENYADLPRSSTNFL
jgi:hypothetical protein